MTRISSLFAAAALVVLPMGAFAQPVTAPSVTTSGVAAPAVAGAGKTMAPAGATTSVQTPVTGKTVAGAAVAKPDVKADVKPDAKAPAAKTQVHEMNTVGGHHAKVVVPAKS